MSLCFILTAINMRSPGVLLLHSLIKELMDLKFHLPLSSIQNLLQQVASTTPLLQISLFFMEALCLFNI